MCVVLPHKEKTVQKESAAFSFARAKVLGCVFFFYAKGEEGDKGRGTWLHFFPGGGADPAEVPKRCSSGKEDMGPPCSSKEDKLDGMNFAHWRLTMMLWFQKKGLWVIMTGKEASPVRIPNSVAIDGLSFRRTRISNPLWIETYRI